MKQQKKYYLVATNYAEDYDYGYWHEKHTFEVVYGTRAKVWRGLESSSGRCNSQPWHQTIEGEYETQQDAEAEKHVREVKEYNRFWEFEIECGEMQPKTI